MTRTRHRSAIFAHAAELHAPMQRDLALVREAQYAAAVDACNGNLVNARGRAAGVTSWDVFTGGRHLVTAYGTDELRDHLAAHPRTTLAAFEREWITAHLGGHRPPHLEEQLA